MITFISSDGFKTKWTRDLLIWIAAMMCLAAFAHGQRAENIVRWSVRSAQPQPIAPGNIARVVIKAQIQDGWHVYAPSQAPGGPTAMVIWIPDKQLFRLSGPIKSSEPEIRYDPNFEMNTQFYEGSLTLEVPLLVDKDAQPGNAAARIDLTYQTCNDKTCLPPATAQMNAHLVIGSAQTAEAPLASTQEPSDRPSGPTSSSPAVSPSVQSFQGTSAPQQETKLKPLAPSLPGRGGLGSLLWLAAVMGALSLLTPCVFPMVPITVSYFSAHAGKNRRAAVSTALVYGAGIILTFTACGTFLAVFFGAGGVNKFAANPWVNLFITAIFLAFGFALFGAYFLQVPSWLTERVNALSRSKEGNPVLGTLLMGVTFTLTSFTCTSPFVGTLLVMTAEGNWRWPLLGTLVFASVFAAPFIVLALAPQLISQLPKAGGWMNSVKVAMGFLEIAAAMKFLSNSDLVWHWGIFTRQVVLSVWIGIGLLLVLNLLGYLRMPHDSPLESIGALRFSVCMVVLAVTIWLIPGLFGRQLGELESFLPPEVIASPSRIDRPSVSSGPDWILNDYSGALAEAKRQDKLVFIDFTGYTCTNCRWMEANMFSRADVAEDLSRLTCLRLYTDGVSEVYERQQQLQQEKFGTVALPYYAIVRPDGTTVATFAGLTRDSREFLAFLKRVGQNGW
jgi:thiol:disulfide interchange protein DsbD